MPACLTQRPQHLLLFLLVLVGTAYADEARSRAPVRSPVPAEASLEHFQLADALRIELVAAEPEVVDPVAIRFDERGRMWVAEMRDYPHGPNAGEPPMSRVRILEDRDDDGRYETSTLFADELLFVTGLQPWNGGAFVTLAGAVVYMKDTTGDGQADVQERWYRGFAEENPQLRANHPRLALNGYIYVANGLRGGDVVDARRPEAPRVSISGMDFRFNPHTGDYGAVTGVGQFGLTFGDFQERFVCSNRNPLVHIVLEDRYLKRSPSVAVPASVQDVAQSGAESRVFPLTDAWTTSTLHAGQFTAACGVLLYRGDALPPSFYGNGFTCEPTGNLVHREILRTDGASFTARPAEDGHEFLASTDPWFRPVNLEAGPDGALYVVDMYRAVIEHPQFMPEELKTRPDLRLGDDRGRIYRIVPDEKRRVDSPELDRMSNVELVDVLEHPNAWTRETAFRLLVERQDGSITSQLARLAARSTSAPARVAALWLLRDLDACDARVLRGALADADPGVRAQAVVLAEDMFNEAGGGELREAVVRLADDDNTRVRFQVALSLVPAQASEINALKRVALNASSERWTREAVALSAGELSHQLLVQLLRSPDWRNKADVASNADLSERLATVVGRNGDDSEVASVLQAVAELQSMLDPSVSFAILNSLGEVRSARLPQLIERVIEDQRLRTQLNQIFARALEVAQSNEAPAALRAQAIELLAFYDTSDDVLMALAIGGTDIPIRTQAIASLARSSSKTHWSRLLEQFPRESPVIRRAIVEGLLANTERTKLLLDAITAGKLRASELDLTHRQRLIKSRDASIRERAERMLADAVPEERRAVLKRYQPALALEGDPLAGRQIFGKNCATCHQIGDLGVNVAPDIADSRTKTREQLLTDILQPNAAIDNNYISYTVVTTDGRVLTGVLGSESSGSITLLQPEGKRLTLLRTEIEELLSNGISLMPEGMEKEITVEQMSDLLAFIKNWRYIGEM